jgi:hypothetical protein
MTEIKKTLAILKARWPEATLIVWLSVLPAVLGNRFRVVKSNLSIIGLLLYLGVSLSFMVVYTIFNCGFLRTVYLEGKKQQSPTILLKTGKYFFWRIVRFVLLLMLAYIPLFVLILFVIKLLTSQYLTYLLIYQLSITSTLIILIKPLLLMPSLIIVLDCRVLKSWKFLKHCKLIDAKELVVLFFFQMMLPFLWIFLGIPYGAKAISQYMLTIGPTIITYFTHLMVVVMAVRFVASLHLVYDNPPSSLDFEDLRK